MTDRGKMRSDGNIEKRFERFFKSPSRWKEKLEQWHKQHMEYHKQHDRSSKEHEELKKLNREISLKKAELLKYQKHFKYARIVVIVLNLIIWYVIFRFTGIKTVSISFAILISIGGIIELVFQSRIQKTVFEPIIALRKGVEEIANGNYDVRVDINVRNDMDLLADSFNNMAEKLSESEKIKTEYENNRKALIANISHDLKTPITSINGYIEAVLEVETMPEESLKKYLRIISNNTTYMNKLIDDLFLFSKLDLQKLEFKFETIRIKPYFNDLMEEFKYEVEERKIRFIYNDRLEGDHKVEIDMKRLQQVFRNVIGNAVKYGDNAELTITVDLYEKDGYVCTDIGDNGPGIPEDKLAHIFDRFYRIDNERTKDLMSTGLGLSIAKELVDAHKGKISVSSRENKGTCFTIQLPIGE
jgi:signal transduction histidine kinase